jgi:hypothetical protein
MSSPNSPTLTIDVSARRAERHVALLTLLAGACGVVLLSALDAWLAGLLVALCVGCIAMGLQRVGWIGSSQRILGVTWLADGRWLLRLRNEHIVPAELSSDTRVSRHAVWLSWITATRQRRFLLLTSLDLPAHELRQLTVRLRIEATERALPEFARP